MNETFLTVLDEDGIVRPMAAMWPAGKYQEFYQTEIDKWLRKNPGCKLVEVEVKIIKQH